MAEKRMFNKKIVESADFYEMPATAQSLYIHLCMDADDDGFNNQVSLAMFKSHATSSDLELLFAKNFIISFEGGIVVIKHWKINNTIRKDTYKPTAYLEYRSLLDTKDNGSYTIRNEPVTSPSQFRNVEQIRLDKIRLDKISIEQTTVCDLLTTEEFWELDSKYENILDLIDLVDGIYKGKFNEIRNAYNLIKTIADRNNWLEK